MENQQERMEKHMKQIADTHRSKVAMLESQFLQQKQQLLRGTDLNSLEVLLEVIVFFVFLIIYFCPLPQ